MAVIRVIDRYLLGEAVRAFAAIVVTFLLVMVTLLFLRMFETVALGQLNPDLVLRLVGFQALRYLPRLLPPAFFFAVLFVLIRMHRDSEMIAFAAGGIGPRRIYRAVLFPTLPLALLAAWFSLEVAPGAAASSYQILAEQKQKGAELAGLREGRFNEYSKGDLVVYVESIEDDRSMKNLFIQHRQHDRLELATAASGHYRFDGETGDHYVTLLDGYRYQGMPGQADYAIARFDRYTLRVAREEPRTVRKSAGLTTAELLRSPGDRSLRVELEDRFSYPLSVITLALIAIPLSRSLPRQGMYGRLIAAFLVYVTFLNLHSLAQNWLETGVTPPWLGMWWFQGVMLLIGALVLLPDTHAAQRFKRGLHGRLARG